MDINRFVANLKQARKYAVDVITSKNNVAKEHAQIHLNYTINNMIEELNTLNGYDGIEKDMLR